MYATNGDPCLLVLFFANVHLPRNRQMELGWAGRSGGLDARRISRRSAGGGIRTGAGGFPRVGAPGRNGKQGQGKRRASGSDGEDVEDDEIAGREGNIHRSSSAPDFLGSNDDQRRTQVKQARGSPLAGGRNSRRSRAEAGGYEI